MGLNCSPVVASGLRRVLEGVGFYASRMYEGIVGCKMIPSLLLVFVVLQDRLVMPVRATEEEDESPLARCVIGSKRLGPLGFSQL